MTIHYLGTSGANFKKLGGVDPDDEIDIAVHPFVAGISDDFVDSLIASGQFEEVV